MSSVSRAHLLGVAGAAAVSVPALFAELVRAAESADASDVALLNRSIERERAAVKAYTDAAQTGLLSADSLALSKGFLGDHQAHRDALIAAVKAGGGTPSEETLHLEYPPLKSEDDILNFVYVVERSTADAYLGTVPAFKDRDLAKTIASILGVETTHVALLGSALKKGSEPYPGSFVGA